MTQSGQSDTLYVIEGDRLAIHLPRAVVEGTTTLILDGYGPGLAIEHAGADFSTPMIDPASATAAVVESLIRQREPWLRCRVPGLEATVAVRSDRVVGIITPLGSRR